MIKDDKNKELMITIIKETQDKYHFDLIVFEILDDHFHFVIGTLPMGETISKIMQRIKSVFARRYNKIHGRIGPVWNERFKSIIIEQLKDSVNYFLRNLWYMAYNSCRKNKVKNPREYKYGSINYYLNENWSSKLKIKLHKIFINLGLSHTKRVKAFLIYEELYIKGFS